MEIAKQVECGLNGEHLASGAAGGQSCGLLVVGLPLCVDLTLIGSQASVDSHDEISDTVV